MNILENTMSYKLKLTSAIGRTLGYSFIPVLMAAAMAGSAAPAYAKTCKPNVISATAGTSVTNLGARAKARIGWNAVVASKYGVAWASWALSSGKTYTCKKKGINWQCTSHSKPCRL